MTATRRGEGFGRSASDAALRGAILVAVAVIIGALLIWRGHKDNKTDGLSTTATTASSTTSRPAATGSTTTTRPGGSTTTTRVVTSVNNPPVGATRAAATVKALVANGSGTTGLATKVNDKLASLNYAALGPVNAKNSPQTNIYYREGYQEDAKGIASALNVSFDRVEAIPVNMSDKLDTAELNRAQTANVVIILGTDNLVKVG